MTQGAIFESLGHGFTHQIERHIIQTEAWSQFRFNEAAEKGQWQFIAFAAGAGAQFQLLRAAIKAGAKTGSPLVWQWGAALNGSFAEISTTGPAFRWVLRLDDPHDERVQIRELTQATVAGGCPECIRLTAETGQEIARAWQWVSSLKFNIPRVKAAAAVLYTDEPERLEEWIEPKGWITKAAAWARSRVRRQRGSDAEWGQMLRLNAQIEELAERHEVKITGNDAGDT